MSTSTSSHSKCDCQHSAACNLDSHLQLPDSLPPPCCSIKRLLFVMRYLCLASLVISGRVLHLCTMSVLDVKRKELLFSDRCDNIHCYFTGEGIIATFMHVPEFLYDLDVVVPLILCLACFDLKSLSFLPLPSLPCPVPTSQFDTGFLMCPMELRSILSFQPDIFFGLSTTSSLVAYSDADWAGCPTTHRSTSDYCVFLGNNLLSWSSKRQVTLSCSSAEAEYRGVVNVVAETCWLRNLLRELHTPLFTATLVYCDNVSAVYLSTNPVQHQRTKHIEIDIHFVRDLVADGHIRVLHVPSRYQYADVFTKGLPTTLFDEFRSSLSVRSSPAQTAGGC
ncbi:ribonuclease H-like domain-containing protein [Tanacetum coccineum]